MFGFKKFFVFFLSFLLVFCTFGFAFADESTVSSSGGSDVVGIYEPVSATNMSFKKFLIVGSGDNIPNVTFGYTIEAGSGISLDTSDNDVMEVHPGVMPVSGANPAQTISISSTTFSNEDTSSAKTAVASGDIDVARLASERASGLTAATGVQFETDKGEKYVTKVATVTFTNIKFDEPGIYRYIIRETANEDNASMGIMNDNDSDRVLDIYVVDDGSGTLVISEYVLHTNANDVVINSTMGSGDVASAGAPLRDKTDGFTNEYGTKDLVFKKGVSGNQASRDKAFEFTVTVGNLSDNDVFSVSLSDDNDVNTTDGNASTNSGSTSATRASNRNKENPVEVTGKNLGAGVKFYLKHGQSIAIRGLPLDAQYSVVEDPEDYKSTGSALTGYTDSTSGVMGDVAGTNKVVMTSFENTRSGFVPTGIILGFVPYVFVALFGSAFVLVVLLNYRYKKRDNG